MSVGQIIKFYRKEKGFTQSDLAEIIGVSIQAMLKVHGRSFQNRMKYQTQRYYENQS